MQQSFPLSEVLPPPALTPLHLSQLVPVISFASLYHVPALSFFTPSPLLSRYLPRHFPPTAHFLRRTVSLLLRHLLALPHLSLVPFCAKCLFIHLSRVCLSGDRSEYILVEREDKHEKAIGNGASGGNSVIVIFSVSRRTSHRYSYSFSLHLCLTHKYTLCVGIR